MSAILDTGEQPQRTDSEFEPGDALFGALMVLGERKGAIALITLLAVAIGVAIALLLPPTFTARTTVLPPQQQAGGGMGSLNAIAASIGAGGLVKTPDELYLGLLKTDAIANDLVEQFKLRDRYNVVLAQDARRVLAQVSRFSADRRSSLITIEVDDSDPKFAAQLANAYVDRLRRLMTRIAVTEAQQRRIYFETQIDKTKNDLASAEVAAKHAQDRSGLQSVDVQTQSTISSAAQIRAQIVADEVRIRALQPYAGPENLEMRRLQSELSSLRAQLARIEGGTGDPATGSVRDNPQALANVRIFRELKYQEAMYSAMLQQLQLARADEARDGPLIQQVDVAMPPERKSKPRRAIIVAFAFALGLLGGLLYAFARSAAARLRTQPETARRWERLARVWRLRSSSSIN